MISNMNTFVNSLNYNSKILHDFIYIYMFDNIEKIENADLKNYNTFKIGGKGTIVFPKNVLELKKTIKNCENNKLNYLILGNGSNLLFPDYDFDTILISLKKFNKISKKQNIVYVEAGVNIYSLNNYCLNNSLTNLEWSYGIPASFGGLVYMNSGAYEHSIFDYIKRVKVLYDNKVVWINKKDIKFSYRKSNIDGIILGAEIKLNKSDKKTIENKQKYYLECRKSSQPLNYPSAGSIFKRKNDIIPAKLIDNLGLKGTRIGGAEISKKHAGFIVNIDNAKSIDVRALIDYIKNKVGIDLEEEIIILN